MAGRLLKKGADLPKRLAGTLAPPDPLIANALIFSTEQATALPAKYSVPLSGWLKQAWQKTAFRPSSARGSNQIRHGRLARGHRGGFYVCQRRPGGAGDR